MPTHRLGVWPNTPGDEAALSAQFSHFQFECCSPFFSFPSAMQPPPRTQAPQAHRSALHYDVLPASWRPWCVHRTVLRTRRSSVEPQLVPARGDHQPPCTFPVGGVLSCVQSRTQPYFSRFSTGHSRLISAAGAAPRSRLTSRCSSTTVPRGHSSTRRFHGRGISIQKIQVSIKPLVGGDKQPNEVV